MTLCVCGRQESEHVAETCPTGCTCYELDDGTPTHSSCLTVDHRNPANQYEGQYKPKDGYRI